MGRKRMGRSFPIQYSSTLDSALSAFAVPENRKNDVIQITGTADFCDQTREVNTALRWVVNEEVSRLKASNPTLTKKDILGYRFSIRISEILEFMAYESVENVDVVDSIMKQLVILRSSSLVIQDSEGFENINVEGFYHGFTIDTANMIVSFELSREAIDMWCSQLEGNPLTIRFVDANLLSPAEKQLDEYVENILYKNPELLDGTGKVYAVEIKRIKSFFFPYGDERMETKPFNEFNRTFVKPAIEHIALHTDISFKIRKKKGEKPAVHYELYDFVRYENTKYVNRKEEIIGTVVAEKEEVVEPLEEQAGETTNVHIDVADALFIGAAGALGFTTPDAFELNELFRSDREKLMSAHEAYLHMLRAGMDVPNEITFIKVNAKRT